MSISEPTPIRSFFFGKNCLIKRDLKDKSLINQSLNKSGIFPSCLLLLNQIHGSEVVVIDNRKKLYDGETPLPRADAIVTNLRSVAIGIITADCSPIIAFDRKNFIIAAIHAGWKGAKLGVVENTIASMRSLGAQDIEVLIGPTIQQHSYEVSKDFLDEFLIEDLSNSNFFIDSAVNGKFLFDLPSYVVKKLKMSGVKTINNSCMDTYSNPQDFFSFRRSNHLNEEDCGRNVSIVMIE